MRGPRNLAAVTCCFAIAPYTKFSPVIYRFPDLVHDASESETGAAQRD